MNKFLLSVVLIILALANPAHAGEPSTGELRGRPSIPDPGSVWGARGIRLNLNFDPIRPLPGKVYAGQVTFDCGDGSFESATLDNNGGFMAVGTYLKGQGGPSRPDQIIEPVRARYFGQIYNVNEMTLIMILENDSAKPQVFSLKGGHDSILHRCL